MHYYSAYYYGMGYANHDKTTCTACAGTLLLEFAALSRLTGDPEFEVKAHRAMEFIWQKRHQGHNLVCNLVCMHVTERKGWWEDPCLWLLKREAVDLYKGFFQVICEAFPTQQPHFTLLLW